MRPGAEKGRRTMGKVTMIGTFTCKDGKAEETDAVLAEMVEAARSEPGVEIYSYHRGEGNTYWFFALMADNDSMAKHGQTDAMRAAMESFGPLVSAPPQVSVTTPISALGLDLLTSR
jgi:quinol monooxygenase YgiN